MSTTSEIVSIECERLNSLGIPYQYVNAYEGLPVAVVDDSTMDRIVDNRIEGQFVCQVDKGRWSAAFTDLEGSQKFKDHLTECKAYRMVLGYPVGRKPLHTKFAGQIPTRKPKEKRKKSWQ